MTVDVVIPGTLQMTTWRRGSRLGSQTDSVTDRFLDPVVD